ncbi:MAG: Crp/Fnr family transcriptional regulator, partial [Bacteroidota bacterium]
NKKEVVMEPGEQLVRSGDKITHFLYLQSGLLKLFTESDSRREHIISISRPRDFVGLLNIFSDTYHRYSMSAITDVRFCMIEVDCIKQLVDNNGFFARELLKNMSIAVDHILKDSYNLRSLQMHGRVAYVLYEFSTEIFGSMEFELPLSRKEVGQMVGVSTENVIRVLSEFRQDGIIRIEGKKIYVLEPERLRLLTIRG